MKTMTLTDPVASINASETIFVGFPTSVEVLAAVFTSHNHLKYYKTKYTYENLTHKVDVSYITCQI